MHVTRADLRDALATDNSSAAVPRWRGRRNLIATQVAVSVGLAVIAALCIQQTIVMAGRQPSIDVRRLAAVTLDFRMQGEPETRARQTLDRIADSARTERGVQAVALASALPLGQATRSAWLSSDVNDVSNENSYWRRRVSAFVAASPELFDTLELRLSRGRGFDARDTSSALQVAVLSEAAARAVFETSDAIGRQLWVRRQPVAGEAGPAVAARTVVGVVPDVSTVSDADRPGGVIYVPFSQHYESRMKVVARTGDDAAGLAGRLESAIRRADPDLAVADRAAGMALTGVNDLPLKIVATMAGLLGLLALVLSMAGLYGVLAHLVTRRTREIGLRLALGAERADIVRLVVRDGLRPVLEGLVLGFGFGVVLRMAMRPLFVRLMPSMNWELLLLVPVPFVTAALLAAYIPARRAARVDPNVALRHL